MPDLAILNNYGRNLKGILHIIIIFKNKNIWYIITLEELNPNPTAVRWPNLWPIGEIFWTFAEFASSENNGLHTFVLIQNTL